MGGYRRDYTNSHRQLTVLTQLTQQPAILCPPTAQGPQFCGLYSIPPVRLYTSVAAGPAQRFAASSRLLTSRSLTTLTQQQQQQPLTKSSPQLPSILYKCLIRVRCSMGNTQPSPIPHARLIATQCPLVPLWPSRSVGSALRDFCESRYAVRPERMHGQNRPV